MLNFAFGNSTAKEVVASSNTALFSCSLNQMQLFNTSFQMTGGICKRTKWMRMTKKRMKKKRVMQMNPWWYPAEATSQSLAFLLLLSANGSCVYGWLGYGAPYRVVREKEREWHLRFHCFLHLHKLFPVHF